MVRFPKRTAGAMTMAVVAVAAVLGGCGQSSPKTATPTWPPGDPFPLVEADATSGPYLPWNLVRVDRRLNRVYLAVSGGPGCTIPQRLAVSETAAAVTLTVVGATLSEPCSAEARTTMGYVQLPTALGDRQVLHGQG